MSASPRHHATSLTSPLDANGEKHECTAPKRRGTRRRRSRRKSKLGLVSFVERLLTEIRPSPVNEKLYRPISDSDPEILELARSIQERGLLEPIVISRDDVILSGHRRHVACRLAGLTSVTCRVEDILSTDKEFLCRLRECNRQRVKSLDEMAREEIAATHPEEAYPVLLEHRKQQARVHAETIRIRGVKDRALISSAKEPMLSAILKILEARREFWPLTERQIHYALLNDPPLVHARKPQSTYRNTVQCYKATCELVTRARLEGSIPFEAIEDATRLVQAWDLFPNARSFLRFELDRFLNGYHRDLQQSQPNQIEIIGEKNTIASIIAPVAARYCIPMTIGRGYCSVPPRRAMQQRFHGSGKEKLIILALGDFDPEGEDIVHAFVRSMRDDFEIDEIEAIKVALTAEQVEEFRLPPKMKAKKTSSRYDDFVERHGEDVFELEALPPEHLQTILAHTIDRVLKVNAFNAEIDAEKQDAAWLTGARRALQKNFDSLLPQPNQSGE